ncbi:MAG: bifunctional [glutamine synthetase] adenylyltransferase/[glutamine synthetase]-adenylyl-L-tyrosine phosphorylase [Actinomycetaceae bacterium]|nr:bifunctional [glutamine synthetase] adenylyltransferase/[glutamine synthetase]-adenylyl-L-tyrosine phosphorylase [Actinomycetaceae bacterium]
MTGERDDTVNEPQSEFPVGPLVAAGFVDVSRAQAELAKLRAAWPALVLVDAGAWFVECADPDQALLGLVKLAEVDPQRARRVLEDAELRRRVLVLFGSSRALANYVLTHRTLLDMELPALPRPRPVEAGPDWAAGADEPTEMVAWLSRVLDEDVDTVDEIRRAYWSAMILIAFEDVTAPDREAHMPTLSAKITDLVDATLILAYQRAVKHIANPPEFCAVAMGKTGGQELNYISDVDVMYIYRGSGQAERELARVAGQIATDMALTCSGPGSEPPLWNLDAGLRPEGRDGALVRSLESYRTYYRSWAKNWEFQALMKARYCAGSRALAADFLQMVQPLVWSVAHRDGFVDDVRGMRKTVEAHIPRGRVEREIKLGPGGLRDIEFSVQLLQLVHGRTDQSVRVRNTLTAIERLSQGGYIARSDAAELDACYRFLRTIEHRAQLTNMRRTHLIPTSPAQVRAIARATSMRKFPRGEDLVEHWQCVRARVRGLQQSLFYRPLVEATAKLTTSEVLMDEGAARDRLSAFGYRDPAGALRHVEALMKGTSRTAVIQRHLLPVMLGWFASGADPDRGLLNFRALSERIGSTHWYMALLRDSRVAARRLAEVLPTSTFAVNALMDQPQAVQWLDDEAMLKPRPEELLRKECAALVDRHDHRDSAMERVRYVHYREVTRSALADLTEGLDYRRAKTMLAPATDQAILAALDVASAQYAPADSGLCVTAVALGRYGGAEAVYGSDADAMFVYDRGDMDEGEAQDCSEKIVKHALKLLGQIGASPAITVDTALRPEGKNGAIVRSLDSYREYWLKWASAWERQAMTRARVIGQADLDRRVSAVLDEFVWLGGLDDKQLRQIKLLKARMEQERLPRGVKPSHHLKLGPGGLSDVEWVVQVQQLQHALDNEKLRTYSTIDALRELTAMGAISDADARILEDAWVDATHHRAANVLATNRVLRMDELAHDGLVARQVARILGYDANQTQTMIDEHLRLARRARQVFEKLFI